MYNAADTTQTTAVSVATSTSTTSATSVADGDPLQFAKELQDKLAAGMDSVAAALERMAAAFPGATITTQSMGTFGDARAQYSASSAEISVNLDQAVLEQMALDEEFFQKVEEMVSQLLSAGQQQNLVSTGATHTSRNVSITAEGVRYVEVQRGANGTQMSLSSLALQADEMIGDLLEQLLEQLKSNRSAGTSAGSSTSSGSSALSALFGGSSSSSSSASSSSSSSFDWLLSGSSWRFESYLSSSSSSASGTFQRITSQQVQQQSMELTISQWVESGATVDLMAYMEVMGLCDPLVLDLGGEGINLRSAEDGVYFDIKGDGSPVRTAFIQGNNAFLYLDGNGNGVADDVKELFGDYGGYANGFEKLAQYDDNGDGIIDANDSIYGDLRVWRDLNGDGVNQAEESMSLAQAGVASINLRYDDSKTLDASGNVIGESSTFTRSDGSSGTIVDAWLRNLG